MEYLFSLASIILINILLSGDNALVIALASRRLSQEQQKKAMFWGSGGAILLRILLTFIAVLILQTPYVQLLGGLLLLWIACKLIADDKENHGGDIEAQDNLWDAVKTIITADLVMSLDNVIAIAGAARGNIPLLIIGLAISIPIIVWGSRLIGRMMQKWPIIINIGAAFLGWTAGEMITSDQKLAPVVSQYAWTHWGIPAICAISVLVVGKFLSTNRKVLKNQS